MRCSLQLFMHRREVRMMEPEEVARETKLHKIQKMITGNTTTRTFAKQSMMKKKILFQYLSALAKCKERKKIHIPDLGRSHSLRLTSAPSLGNLITPAAATGLKI